MTELEVRKLVQESEQELKDVFAKVEEVSFQNTEKVLKAFQEHHFSTAHFDSTTGYGYDDLGRDTLES